MVANIRRGGGEVTASMKSRSSPLIIFDPKTVLLSDSILGGN